MASKAIIPENRFSFMRFNKTVDAVASDLPITVDAIDRASTVTLSQQGYALRWVVDFDVSETQVFQSTSGVGAWSLIGVTNKTEFYFTDISAYYKVVVMKKKGGYSQSNVVKSTPTYSLSNITDTGVADSSANNQSWIRFSPDGMRSYFLGSLATIVVTDYLSRPFDLGSTIAAGSSKTLLNNANFGQFSTNGTFFFGLAITDDVLRRYALTTPWDISTAGLFDVSLNVNATDNTMDGFKIVNEGAELYFIGDQNNNIYRYTMSKPWDLSTATLTTTQSISGTTASPDSIEVSENGEHIYFADGTSLYHFTLSTAYDLTTMSLTETAVTVSSSGLSISYVSGHLYLIDGSANILQYTI